MRKQLGIITSLLFLGVSTLLWTGCHNRSCDPVQPQGVVCGTVGGEVCPDPCYESLCKPLTKCC